MTDHLLFVAAGTAGRCVSSLREMAMRSLDRAQLRLAALRLAHDQEAQRWAQVTKAEMGNDEWLESAAAQPSPEEIFERWRDGTTVP